MKKLIFVLAFTLSLASFAGNHSNRFNSNGFTGSLAVDAQLADVTIKCGAEGAELAAIYERGNRVAEMHNVEGTLPDQNEMCESAIIEALRAGATENEVLESLK